MVARGTTRKPITPRGSSLLTEVSEFINPVSGEWDEQLIHDLFWPKDAAISQGELGVGVSW